MSNLPKTERENIREATLEGLNTAARKGNHGGRPLVVTNNMLHTQLAAARRASPSGISVLT